MPIQQNRKQPSTMVVDPSCKPQTYHGSSTWFLPKDQEWVLVTRKHRQKKKPTNSTKINKPTRVRTEHKTRTSTNKPHMDNKTHTKRSTMPKSNSSPRSKAHLKTEAQVHSKSKQPSTFRVKNASKKCSKIQNKSPSSPANVKKCAKNDIDLLFPEKPNILKYCVDPSTGLTKAQLKSLKPLSSKHKHDEWMIKVCPR